MLNSFVLAQNIAEIKIQIYDLWSLKPLPGVLLSCDNQISKTDAEGIGCIKSIKRDSVSFSASLAGYYKQDFIVKNDDQTQWIYLQPVEQLSGISISAERYRLTNLDLPGAKSIVNLQGLSLSDEGRISQLLSQNSGVFIKDYGASSALKSISIRGLGAEHTLIAFDGIGLNNPQLGSLDLASLGTAGIQSMEIYRGGNSSLFGSGASAGVINFVPSRPEEKAGYRLTMQTGSWEKYRGNLEIDLPISNFRQKLVVNYNIAQNNYPFEIAGDKVYRKNTCIRESGIGYNFSNSTNTLFADFFYNSMERGVAKAVFENNHDDDAARQNDDIFFSRLKWRFTESDEIQTYGIFTKMTYFDPNILINTIALQSTHHTKKAGLIFRSSKSLHTDLLLNFKGEADYTSVNSSDAGKHNKNHLAIAGIMDWQFYKLRDLSFVLNSAFRGEFLSNSGSILLPKTGVQLKSDRWNAYVSIGRNFRSPTFNELYWQPGGNPDLLPEKSTAIEAGLKALADFAGTWQFSTDYYVNSFSNMIRWQPTANVNIWQPQNITSVRSEGIELQTIYTVPGDKITINANYSFGNTVKSKPDFSGDKTSGNQLPFVPRERINLSVSAKYSELYFTISGSRTSFRYLTIQNDNDDILPAFNLLNLILEYQFNILNHLCNFTFSVDNVTDNNYSVMPGYPMPGRRWGIGLNINSNVLRK